MKFWDASAVVPLLVDEPQSERVLAQLREDPIMLVWWGTPVECTSAIARRERDGSMPLAEATESIDRLRHLGAAWVEVLPTDTVRSIAQRVLRVHALRAADSLQLAAALVAADGQPTDLPFVCLDDRLTDAASREGFPIESL